MKFLLDLVSEQAEELRVLRVRLDELEKKVRQSMPDKDTPAPPRPAR